uniref:Putative hexapeptide repeat-containing transferase n=1 Tax=viral metagenome TaxID=1070528 RepID=A0A6H1ZE99_9ZZZZ
MTHVWNQQLSNIHPSAEIGEDCTIHSHVWIGANVKIGKRCKIQAFVFIPDGVTIGDDVFIAPHVCFTNDRHPPSNGKGWEKTFVEDGAVIGAGAVILPGLTVGERAMVAAGTVVTKDVPPYTVVMNNREQIYKSLLTK